MPDQASYWYEVPAEFGANVLRIHKASLYDLRLLKVSPLFGVFGGYRFEVSGGVAIASKRYPTEDAARAAGEAFWKHWQEWLRQHNAACDLSHKASMSSPTRLSRLMAYFSGQWAYFKSTEMYRDWKALRLNW